MTGPQFVGGAPPDPPCPDGSDRPCPDGSDRPCPDVPGPDALGVTPTGVGSHAGGLGGYPPKCTACNASTGAVALATLIEWMTGPQFVGGAPPDPPCPDPPCPDPACPDPPCPDGSDRPCPDGSDPPCPDGSDRPCPDVPGPDALGVTPTGVGSHAGGLGGYPPNCTACNASTGAVALATLIEWMTGPQFVGGAPPDPPCPDPPCPDPPCPDPPCPDPPCPDPPCPDGSDSPGP